jgi:hypothetical protein
MGRILVALIVLAASSAGCVLDGPTDNPRISNESGVDVEILLVSPGFEDQSFAMIAAGQTHEVVQYAGSCFPNHMVAKTEAGEVVGRTDHLLCPDDLWVIEPPP